MKRSVWARIECVRLVFVLDCKDPDGLAAFRTAAIGYRVSSSSEPYVVLVPENGHGPELVLQRVGEPKTTKNRMHLDIRTDELGSAVQHLEALGARRLQPGVTEEAGFRWVVMADPEGNEFCVGTEPRTDT
jgi:predicted enzyme related to lactoylglutathione lyase